jgi:hypothetical protein
MMEVDRRLFLLIHPCCEARPYSYRQCRDDDEYALQLVRDIYSMRGGRIHIEEFDPEKHVLGYKPKIER